MKKWVDRLGCGAAGYISRLEWYCDRCGKFRHILVASPGHITPSNVLLCPSCLRELADEVEAEGGGRIMYIYVLSEPGLWTVGFYDPTGKWHPESDHPTEAAAADRVHWLNGGK